MIIGSAITLIIFLAFWIWMRRRTHRLHRQLHAAMDQCECEQAQQRAQEMRDSVQATITKIESRDEQKREAATSPGFPVLAIAMLAVFLFGVGVGREQRILPVGVMEETNRSASPHGQVKTKLAELRTSPTLATVVYFRARKPDAEVVDAMRIAARSPDGPVAFAAQTALAHWRER